MRFTPANVYRIERGHKRCTTRRDRHGRKGDTFRVGEKVYEIFDVRPVSLRAAFDLYYPEEGYDSPAEFQSDWMACYGLDTLPDLNTVVYVHPFHEKLPNPAPKRR